MKTKPLPVFLLLFIAFCHSSFAMISVGQVSKKRAKELGIELRARAGGPKHAWIELEFKAGGKLEKFRHVSLEVPDGGELALGWTPLKDRRTSNGNVIVRVMGSRKFLENVTLRIVLGDFGGTGLDVRIRDFVDLDDLPGAALPKGTNREGKPDPTEAPPATESKTRQ